DSRVILAPHPYAGTPFLRALELFVRQIRQLAAFARKRERGIDRRRILHRQIAEAAQPRQARLNRRAVELDGGSDAHDIRMIKLKSLGDFDVPIAPNKLQFRRSRERSCRERSKMRGQISRVYTWLWNLGHVKSGICQRLKLRIVEH